MCFVSLIRNGCPAMYLYHLSTLKPSLVNLLEQEQGVTSLYHDGDQFHSKICFISLTGSRYLLHSRKLSYKFGIIVCKLRTVLVRQENTPEQISSAFLLVGRCTLQRLFAPLRNTAPWLSLKVLCWNAWCHICVGDIFLFYPFNFQCGMFHLDKY